MKKAVVNEAKDICELVGMLIFWGGFLVVVIFIAGGVESVKGFIQ